MFISSFRKWIAMEFSEKIQPKNSLSLVQSKKQQIILHFLASGQNVARK